MGGCSLKPTKRADIFQLPMVRIRYNPFPTSTGQRGKQTSSDAARQRRLPLPSFIDVRPACVVVDRPPRLQRNFGIRRPKHCDPTEPPRDICWPLLSEQASKKREKGQDMCKVENGEHEISGNSKRNRKIVQRRRAPARRCSRAHKFNPPPPQTPGVAHFSRCIIPILNPHPSRKEKRRGKEEYRKSARMRPGSTRIRKIETNHQNQNAAARQRSRDQL